MQADEAATGPLARPGRAASVFCGSRRGSTALAASAAALGRALARAGVTVVYGGAQVGCMGLLADAALAAGGRVVGVMTEQLAAHERAHTGLSVLHTVADLAARKEMMAQLADGCVVLPGGIGTLDELFELWTRAALGGFDGPIVICDVDGFYRPLLAMLAAQVASGLLPAADHARIVAVPGPDAAVAALARGWAQAPAPTRARAPAGAGAERAAR